MLCKTRKAFTLIELLVVVTVIGLLVAVLLPAVQMAREAARRMHCSNNLKQLGIALNSYALTHGAFPTLAIYSPHTMLLPYLEQSAIYSSVNFNMRVSDEAGANMTVAHTSLANFLCPSDHSQPRCGTNYAGNCGIGVQKYGFNGIIAPTPVGFHSITDGASQTTAFSEIILGLQGSHDPRRVVYGTVNVLIRPEEFDQFTAECRELKPDPAFILFDDRGNLWMSTDFRTSLYNHSNPVNANSCANGVTLPQGAWSAGSLHPGGANVLFADGHTRFMRESVNLTTWRALGSRNGAELVAIE